MTVSFKRTSPSDYPTLDSVGALQAAPSEPGLALLRDRSAKIKPLYVQNESMALSLLSWHLIA